MTEKYLRILAATVAVIALVAGGVAIADSTVSGNICKGETTYTSTDGGQTWTPVAGVCTDTLCVTPPSACFTRQIASGSFGGQPATYKICTCGMSGALVYDNVVIEGVTKHLCCPTEIWSAPPLPASPVLLAVTCLGECTPSPCNDTTPIITGTPPNLTSKSSCRCGP